MAQSTQHVCELVLQIAGPQLACEDQPGWAGHYLLSRASTIAGGKSEISGNVIAERLLGLPREPLVR